MNELLHRVLSTAPPQGRGQPSAIVQLLLAMQSAANARKGFARMPPGGGDIDGLADTLQYMYGPVRAIKAYAYSNPTTAGDYRGQAPNDTIGLSADRLTGTGLREALMHEFGHKWDHSVQPTGGSIPFVGSDRNGPGPLYEVMNTRLPGEVLAEALMHAFLRRRGQSPSGEVGYPTLHQFITPDRQRFADSVVADRMKRVPPAPMR